jgi:hypothetical protein
MLYFLQNFKALRNLNAFTYEDQKVMVKYYNEVYNIHEYNAPDRKYLKYATFIYFKIYFLKTIFLGESKLWLIAHNW